MLSTQGAITNDIIMVECTSSQDHSAKEVFLLSELERVWEALSYVLRNHLIEGHNVRVANFGSFWFETRPVVSDGVDRYHARRLNFGIDNNFALRYGIDSSKVPQEPSRLEYVKLSMAEVVAAAGVPARTASMALREFFSYIGEGLFRRQLFHINFPGVASLTVKRERAVLEVEAGLRRDTFAIDARRWPLAVREAAAAVVLAPPPRPASRQRPPSSSSVLTSAPSQPRPAFVPAAPRGRLFSEIERDPPRKMPPRRGSPSPSGGDAQEWNEGKEGRISRGAAALTRESVFDALEPEEWQHEEPEIEMIEEVPVELPTLYAHEEMAPTKPRREDLRYMGQEHSSVRDLLYGKAAPESESITRGRRRYINRDSDEVAALLKNS